MMGKRMSAEKLAAIQAALSAPGATVWGVAVAMRAGCATTARIAREMGGVAKGRRGPKGVEERKARFQAAIRRIPGEPCITSLTMILARAGVIPEEMPTRTVMLLWFHGRAPGERYLQVVERAVGM